jgi:hypothetical protein
MGFGDKYIMRENLNFEIGVKWWQVHVMGGLGMLLHGHLIIRARHSSLVYLQTMNGTRSLTAPAGKAM